MEKKVYIIGGGPSLSGFDFDLLSGKEVITVNKSILDIPNPKYFITVDFTFLRKVRWSVINKIRTTKVFVACLHFPFMSEEKGRIVDTRYNIVYDLKDFDVIIKSRKEDGIGFTFREFRNGLNSGYCALQLAVLLGYKEINLMGIDLCLEQNKSHYHEGYGQNLEKFNEQLTKYYTLFGQGLEQIQKESNIKIYSLSPISRLNSIIPYRGFQDSLV